MSSFTNDLIVRSYNETKWQLTEAFKFYFEENNQKTDIIVPKDFITDFASVPRVLWSILPPTGRYTKAAVLHDYLYSNSSKLDFNRKQCDEMFLQAMEILGVKKWVRNTIYRAVRIFGKNYFKKS
jgi:hypothetical protein